MESLLTSRIVNAPEPRPVVTAPSLAARQPAAKPTPVEPQPPRPHAPEKALRDPRQSGGSHVRQGLQHVVREIRHAIGDEVRGSDLDRETVSSIRDLQREFRRDLQALFLQAGRGADVDRHEVLEGMMVALQDLTAGLRELNNRGDDDVVDDAPAASGKPGSLLDITG